MNFVDYETQVHELVAELELQRSQFEGQVTELESKVDAQEKIIAMLKLRLHEEHKARLGFIDFLLCESVPGSLMFVLGCVLGEIAD